METIFCKFCRGRFTLDHFHRRGTSDRTSYYVCKLRQERARRKYLKSRRELVNKAKRVPCADCKNTYPLCVMDFDHVSGDKRMGISEAAVGALSLRKLKEEMSKCEVVCANCHRIRTARRRKIAKLIKMRAEDA